MARELNKPDFPPFLGRGWRFGTPPDQRLGVTLDRRWGRVEMVEGETDVQQAIAIILGTARGERVMRPDFGCGIHELTFETISSPLVAEIKRVVREALLRFEARIDVLRVDVETRDAVNGKLGIDVHYRMRTTNQVGNFVYPFYFQEVS
jgi:phage baseplate assembly protein W